MLIMASAVLLGSCEKEQTEQPVEKETKVTVEEKRTTCSMVLPIGHNDTLDPFKAESAVNRSLITLLYDSLIYIDENFQPELLLADSYSIEGKTLTVGLDSAVFSDSSPITAEDVVYSFELAKKCKYYSERLSDFKAAQIVSDRIVFEMKRENIFALSCLDFPVVKKGTVQDLSSDIELYELAIPVGSGRYTVSGKLPNAKLVVNPDCPRGEKPYITEISLFEVSDSDGLAYGLQIGNYDLWYNDMSSGEYHRVNAGLSVVPTNNFVYLAFNSDKPIFRESAVRKGVSLLLDREQLISMAYHGYAAAAVLPFNPYWGETKDMAHNGSSTSLAQQAVQLLEQAGYDSINTYGYRCSRTKSLTASLLVCSGNSFKTMLAKQIKEQLAAINFNVNIVELDYEQYTEAIKSGEFEMYIGEIKLTPDMNLRGLFEPDGEFNAAIETPSQEDESLWEVNVCSDAYRKVLSGEYSLSDFCILFEDEMPFVPLCYRSATLVYSRNFTTEINATCYDSFYYSQLWQTKTEEMK